MKQQALPGIVKEPGLSAMMEPEAMQQAPGPALIMVE